VTSEVKRGTSLTADISMMDVHIGFGNKHTWEMEMIDTVQRPRQPRRPFSVRNKEKTKDASRISAARLAADTISSSKFLAKFLRDNARSTQCTVENPTIKEKTLKVDGELA
jgi:hypothetical protein